MTVAAPGPAASSSCGAAPGLPTSCRWATLALAALLISASAILVSLALCRPAAAIVSTTITVDGAMGDWGPVLAESGNALRDTIGAVDPDAPGQLDRDIETLAATWDSTNLFLYWQRIAGGSRAVQVFAYVDCDGDGLLEASDRVVILGFGNGGAYQTNANSSNVVLYAPLAPSGDPMFGDGCDPPGDATTGSRRVPGASFWGAGESTGVRFEARVSWSTLGVAPGSPVTIHFACGNGTHAPLQLEDNAGIGGNLSLRYRGVAVEPDQAKAGAAGGSVRFTHTVTNTGNGAETFDLSAASSHGWTTTVEQGGSAVTSVTLAPGGTTTIDVTVQIPSETTAGSRDLITVRAASRAEPSVADTALDTVVVGPLAITPDHRLPATPGDTVLLSHQVTNTTLSWLSVNIAARSSLGWPVSLQDEAGQSISALTLAPGATATVVAALSVPPDAVVGQQDTVRVTATVSRDPALAGEARDVVTVRPALTVEPDQNSFGAAGGAVRYVHTVTNNTSQSHTVNLTAVSSRGWEVLFYAIDGVTRISSVVVGPSGGTARFIARVRIPSGAPAGTTDVTTVSGQSGMYQDGAVDTTVIRRLMTYEDPACSAPRTEFARGETVHAGGTGLSGVANVVFRWIQPGGAIARTSPAIPVSQVTFTAQDLYLLSSTAAVGDWTVVLLNASGLSEIARTQFTVTYNAEITVLSAGNALDAGDEVKVSSAVANRSGAAIDDSTITYVIWWDGNGNGVLDAGDTYTDEAGVSHAYTGSGQVLSHVTTDVDVPAGGTWSEPGPWALSNAAFPNQGTYRLTATWTAADGRVIDTATTEFFSIPALGSLLCAGVAAAGAVLLWHRRRCLLGRRAA